MANASLSLNTYLLLVFYNRKISEKKYNEKEREWGWLWGHPNLEGGEEIEGKMKNILEGE